MNLNADSKNLSSMNLKGPSSPELISLSHISLAATDIILEET